MRIVHTADWHIGLQKDGVLDPETGLSSRVLEVFRAIDEVVDFVVKEKIDLFLIAGDVFHTSNPHTVYKKMLLERLLRLEENGVETRIIPGNHDFSKTDNRKHSLLSIMTYPWKHIKIYTESEVEEISGRFFVFWPYGKILKEIPKNSIVVGHFTISGARVGSERFLVPVLEDPRRKVKGVFFYLLGHVHSHQFFSNVLYSGSLTRISLAEKDEKKGFYVIDDFENFEFVEVKNIFNYKVIELTRTPVESDFRDLTSSDILRLKIVSKVKDKDLYRRIVNLLIDRVHSFDIEIEYKKDQLRGVYLSSRLTPKEAFLKYLEENQSEIRFFEEVKEKGLKFLEEVLDESQTDKIE